MDMSQHFCDVFVAYYIIAISNLHKRTPSIALYDILFEKSQKKAMWDNIFCTLK
jgi:hypothetical protein